VSSIGSFVCVRPTTFDWESPDESWTIGPMSPELSHPLCNCSVRAFINSINRSCSSIYIKSIRDWVPVVQAYIKSIRDWACSSLVGRFGGTLPTRIQTRLQLPELLRPVVYRKHEHSALSTYARSRCSHQSCTEAAGPKVQTHFTQEQESHQTFFAIGH
jgi:hypothetical protein